MPCAQPLSNTITSINNEWQLFSKNTVYSDRVFDIFFTYLRSNLGMFLGEGVGYLIKSIAIIRCHKCEKVDGYFPDINYLFSNVYFERKGETIAILVFKFKCNKL